ncbi:MAG: sialate O-acetylesterase [Actinobacteria bacterium]|nr:sialate O-acetylesterase [Actinomycetota bacterium]
MRKWILLAVALGLLAPVSASSTVVPNPLFSDGAVLQRGVRVPIWGTASPGEHVTVSFDGQKVSTVANGGKWMVHLKPMEAGGPFTLTISGSNTVEIHNVLVGEVWVCSGQSNMEFPLALASNGKEAIQSSSDPMLRLFTVPRLVSYYPQTAVKRPGDRANYSVAFPQDTKEGGHWDEASPSTTGGFSAVAYFFGRSLRRALGVPVGLIHSSWGGTPAEAWTTRKALEDTPSIRYYIDGLDAAVRAYPQQMKRYHEQLDSIAKGGANGSQAPKAPDNPLASSWAPSGLYNGMIAPLIPYAIKGAIWYQGESNAGKAYEYRTLLPTMIRSWREEWGEGDFPFLLVQIAPFLKIQSQPMESAWAELRDAQLYTTQTVPKTAMAVITDVGDQNDIHPRQKEPVGQRLALAAEAIAYGRKVEYSGPQYVQGGRAILSFTHVDGGLVAKDGPLTGFAIAGADRKFVNAQAEIQGGRIAAWSPDVARPAAVRFGWADYPVVNLYNKDGLPASLFRTDNFPLTTQPHPVQK